MSKVEKVISDEAVEAAFRSMYGPSPSNPANDGDAHLLKELRKALEAAAPYMLADAERDAYNHGWGAGYRHTKAALVDPHRGQRMADSDLILTTLEAVGVDKADQFDALVAVQKLCTNPYRSQ